MPKHNANNNPSVCVHTFSTFYRDHQAHPIQQQQYAVLRDVPENFYAFNFIHISITKLYFEINATLN